MASTKLTRRGKAVLAVAVVGAALGYAFGGRSLNAVVVPAAALLAVTRLYVHSFSEPTVERTAPSEGYQGDRRTVELVVDAARPYPATIRDRLSDGLRGDSERNSETDGRTLTYDIELAERGVDSVGPCSVRATDPFGLWTVGFVAGTQERVTVFPRVHALRDTAALLSGYVGVTDDREQFAGVREYERGDPLRDVNWKASAKRPNEFAVTEYAGEGATDRVVVAAEAIGPRADSVAEAAASVAVHLLDAGVAVGVATASGSVEPAHGDPHRRRLLGALAAFERGRLPTHLREDADVVVRAPESGEHVVVTVGGTDYRYAEFVGSGAGPERADRREQPVGGEVSA
ncbi:MULTISPECIES: DUF58 domain-containing protein [Halobacterium]|uniref:DUF58 domain-containing protein n=1 Tax=Halobacterium TaxID=2239 RepID=UPI00073F3796|nr:MULTISPECIES: DUF58 domain-containing protein [Halobacterium]MCG1001939.1 DUF58 domain-containing protein [Halobacterium noricense]